MIDSHKTESIWNENHKAALELKTKNGNKEWKLENTKDVTEEMEWKWKNTMETGKTKTKNVTEEIQWKWKNTMRLEKLNTMETGKTEYNGNWKNGETGNELEMN